MKRIGILSDTHSWVDSRYKKYFGECDEIWHAGDIGDVKVLDALRAVCPTVRAVAGNIDTPSIAPRELSFEVEQVRVYMTHIAPKGYMRLPDGPVDMIVTGHSHILRVNYDRQRQVLCVNPGAAGRHGWQRVSTLVRLTIDGREIRDLEVIELAPTNQNGH